MATITGLGNIISSDQTVTDDLTITDALTVNGNVALGNAAGDLIGFHGATAVDQGAHIADATDAATAISQLNLVIAALEEKGLLATS